MESRYYYSKANAIEREREVLFFLKFISEKKQEEIRETDY